MHILRGLLGAAEYSGANGRGHLFGEVYACLRQVPLTVSVAAPNGATVIFWTLNVCWRVRLAAKLKTGRSLQSASADGGAQSVSDSENGISDEADDAEKALAYLSEQARLAAKRAIS